MPVPDFASAREAGKLPWVEIDPRMLLRLTQSPGTEPYWGKGIKHRFDDPAGTFGVNYAAQTLEVAFAESVLQQGCHIKHKNQWDIPQVRVNERYIIHFDSANATRLRLINLTGPDLARLGLNNDLNALDDYTEPMQVSAALHQQVPEADGIQYVSIDVIMDWLWLCSSAAEFDANQFEAAFRSCRLSKTDRYVRSQLTTRNRGAGLKDFSHAESVSPSFNIRKNSKFYQPLRFSFGEG